MTGTISVAHNEARLQGSADFYDEGVDPAVIQFWTTPRPANGATALGTLLGELFLAKPCGVVASNALTLSVPQETMALVSGSIYWARILNGNRDHANDFDVSVVGGGGEVQVSSVVVFTGGTIRLVSAVFG